MTAQRKRPASAGPVIIETDDLTLGELDQINTMVEAGKGSYNVVTAWVFFQRGGHAKSLDECKKLTGRQVRIVAGSTEPEPDDSPTSPASS